MDITELSTGRVITTAALDATREPFTVMAVQLLLTVGVTVIDGLLVESDKRKAFVEPELASRHSSPPVIDKALNSYRSPAATLSFSSTARLSTPVPLRFKMFSALTSARFLFSR